MKVRLGFGVKFCQVFVSRKVNVRLIWIEFRLTWDKGWLDLNETPEFFRIFLSDLGNELSQLYLSFIPERNFAGQGILG